MGFLPTTNYLFQLYIPGLGKRPPTGSVPLEDK